MPTRQYGDYPVWVYRADGEELALGVIRIVAGRTTYVRPNGREVKR
jgi:hypothetical protein